MTETIALPGQIAFEPIVIQPRLANRNDLRMIGQCQQFLDGGVVAIAFVGMQADRRPDCLVLLGYRQGGINHFFRPFRGHIPELPASARLTSPD